MSSIVHTLEKMACAALTSTCIVERRNADATITQDYATAVALSKNELTGTAAYMSGKIRVSGDLMKLMQLQGPLGQMPGALKDLDVEY